MNVGDALEDLLSCECREKYTIDKNGIGYDIYFGNCEHKPGTKVLHISECHRIDIINQIVDNLNGKGE